MSFIQRTQWRIRELSGSFDPLPLWLKALHLAHTLQRQLYNLSDYVRPLGGCTTHFVSMQRGTAQMADNHLPQTLRR